MCQTVGPLCTLFTDSERVATEFPWSSCCEFSQTGLNHLVITPSRYALQLRSLCGQHQVSSAAWHQQLKSARGNTLQLKALLSSVYFSSLQIKGKWAPKDTGSILKRIVTRNLKGMQKNKWTLFIDRLILKH